MQKEVFQYISHYRAGYRNKELRIAEAHSIVYKWNCGWKVGIIVCDVETTLFGYDPSATDLELRSAILPFVRGESSCYRVEIYGSGDDRQFGAIHDGDYIPNEIP